MAESDPRAQTQIKIRLRELLLTRLTAEAGEAAAGAPPPVEAGGKPAGAAA